MVEPLYVQTGGMTALADIHESVAGAMARLVESTPSADALETAYGTISSAFMSAMRQVIPSREASLQSTKTSSQTIGELLRRAATGYEHGDEEGAAKLRAAADALADSGGTCARGPAGSTGPIGGGGTDSSAQMSNQMGQIAQTVAQAAQGLTQGLTLLPQQIAQGLQAMTGLASTHQVVDAATEAKDRRDAKDEARQEKDSDRRRDDHPDEHPEHRSPSHVGGAQPGAVGNGGDGTAPVPAPPAERPEPAQTRPQ